VIVEVRRQWQLNQGELTGPHRERLTAQGYEVTAGVPDATGRAVLYPGAGAVPGGLPATGGNLVPFEVPDPTPCCADHES
jgi:hypothetical protein